MVQRNQSIPKVASMNDATQSKHHIRSCVPSIAFRLSSNFPRTFILLLSSDGLCTVLIRSSYVPHAFFVLPLSSFLTPSIFRPRPQSSYCPPTSLIRSSCFPPTSRMFARTYLPLPAHAPLTSPAFVLLLSAYLPHAFLTLSV